MNVKKQQLSERVSQNERANTVYDCQKKIGQKSEERTENKMQ